jgi:hypothetical protein
LGARSSRNKISLRSDIPLILLAERSNVRSSIDLQRDNAADNTLIRVLVLARISHQVLMRGEGREEETAGRDGRMNISSPASDPI